MSVVSKSATRALQNLRILPIVLAAGVCLLLMRSLDLMSGGDMAALTTPAQAQSTAAETAQTPSGNAQASDPQADGTSDQSGPAPEAATADPGGRVIDFSESDPQVSQSEQDLRGLLSERRAALEKREEAINLREQLLKAAELNLEQRLSELRALEERIVAAVDKKEEEERQQLQGLVTMYSNMKPKEAATIFDELNMQVLIEVVKAMNPRNMGAILARMSPERAQSLTIELAKPALAAPDPAVATDALPKIGDDTQG